jgi:hypothetical protein
VKWRCEWCGKPHAENDPPCDNCGHSEFEKAVVPAAPEGDETTSDAYGYVWVCTECGNDHPKNTPPCDRCGHDTFERQEIEYDEDEVMDEMLGESRASSTPSADVGYLDVLDAKLGLLAVGVAVLVVVLALGFLGVVDVPGVDIGPTTPTEVPGNATAVDGVSLSAVERAYVSELNRQRTEAGYEPLTQDDEMQSLARWTNRRHVLYDYSDREIDRIDREEFGRRYEEICGEADLESRVFQTSLVVGTDASEQFSTPDELARALVGTPDSFAETGNGIVGVDVHAAPDGKLYVTKYAC